MTWTALQNKAQIDELRTKSFQVSCIILKHSAHCALSMAVWQIFQKDCLMPASEAQTYWIEVSQNPELTQYIAEVFAVHHESPQVLLIKNGECTYEESHTDIQLSELEEEIRADVFWKE